MSERPEPVRVAIFDDHPLVLEGLSAAIAAAPGFVIAGTAQTVEEAVALCLSAEVDVLICDVEVGGEPVGLEVLERLRDVSAPRVLMLSSYDYPALLRTAFERGAAGYLLKVTPTATILEAIRTIAAGGTVFSVAALRTIRTAPRRPTEREAEVLARVAAGAANDAIAADLALSVRTVETHLRRLFDRYGVQSRTELVALAREQGWCR